MLFLLKPKPVLGGYVLRPARLRFEPGLHGLAELRAGGHSRGERNVREADVESSEQLLERAQPLKLAWPIQPIARR